VDNEAARILGYRADEMIGRSLSERFATAAEGNPFDLTGYAPRVLPESGGITLELIGRRRSGGTFPVEASLSAWRGIKGRQYALLFRDVSTRKEQEARIRFLAERDSLTGLANRNTLDLHLAQTMAEPAGDVALLVVGIDRFKQVNDTLGHSCGDMLLCALAERLTVMAADSMVARLSGDEFAVVVAGLRSVERAEALITAIESEFDGRPMSVGPRELRVRVSLGLAVAPRDGKTPEELLGNADMALYRAKLAGRSRCVAFDRAMREQLEKRASLEEALASAAERGEFVLYYQPQINLTTGRLAGAEALIRWRHPERGLIMPAEFMPVANASTLSNRIAEWVLTQSMRQAAEWHRAGNPVRVGVNVAPSQLLAGGFAEQVEALLRVTELPPHLLELEITEDILLAEEEATLATFRRLRELGVHIAFDDFGTGYASLTSLKRFPLNRVKIDKSFVLDLKAGSADAAIVGSTISLSKTLGLEVIAEGVESREVATLLHDMGCDEAQGFYFGRATTADQLQERYFKAAARNARSLAASAA
jgi:diguanylate cyclase (GGDEF)-like protein/PAS domain S-box-containing protein